MPQFADGVIGMMKQASTTIYLNYEVGHLEV